MSNNNKKQFPKNSKSKEEDKLIKKVIGFGDIAFPIPYKSFNTPIYNIKDFKREKLNQFLDQQEGNNIKYSKIKQFGYANKITKYKYTLAGLFVIMSAIVDKSEKAKKVFLSKDFIELYKEFANNLNELSKKLPNLFQKIKDELQTDNIPNALFENIDKDKLEGVVGNLQNQKLNNKELYSNARSRSFVSYIRKSPRAPEIQFRYGGYIIQNKPELDYMVLQSPFAKVQFSVQKSSLLVMFMYMR